MRALFFVLVLANIAFYAWSHYYAPTDASFDAAPLTRQIEPEKLRIVGPGDPVSSVAPPALASGSGQLGCLEWGAFTVADAPRAEKAMEPLALGPRLATRRVEDNAGWWVFISSQGSRAAAAKKAAELKGLGIEYFIATDEGANRWALSLGVFRTEEAAQAHLEALRSRGVRSAQVGTRDSQPKIWLQVKGVDAPLQARLKEIATGLDGTELRECPTN
jgi:hypothetical protein